MRKIILINGLIAGAIVSAMLIISMPLHKQGILNYENGMLVGYASMVISLSMIFFGIKTYRDQHGSGSITFGQAFKIGILIASIASVMYAISWEVYYNVAANDYMEQYSKYYLDKMKEDGATDAAINEARSNMEQWTEAYKNPMIRFAMTLLEIVPVGLVITLISAAVLRKRRFLPA